MNDMLDFPEITAPPAALAPVAAAALDLRKVDLTDVALAQFGEWRKDVAAVKANLSTLALELVTQTNVDEAKSLRWRLIGQPRAGARATAKELKSKLARVSKAIGAEEDAIVLAWDEAESLITPHIDARQAELDAEKAAAAAAKAEVARLEAERRQRHEDGITTLAGYVTKAQGRNAEMLAAGIAFVEKIQIDPAHWQEYTERAAATLAETLATLRTMHAAQVKAEADAAELEALRREKAERDARERQEREAAEAARLARIAEDERRARLVAEREAAAAAAAAENTRRLLAEEQAAAEREAREHAELEAERIADLEAGAPKPQDAELVLAEAPIQQDTMTLPEGGGTIIVVAPDSGKEWEQAMRGNGEPAPADAPLIRGEIGAIAGRVNINTAPDSEMTAAWSLPTMAPRIIFAEPEPEPEPADTLHEQAAAFVALVLTAFEDRFPSHPKPSPAWWAQVRQAGEALRARLA